MADLTQQQIVDGWPSYQQEFVSDGSLRDICVLGTTLADWQRVAAAIATYGYELSFSGRFEASVFPDDLRKLFTPADENALLSIDLSGVYLHCHFFEQKRIEFDLLPAEVNSSRDLAKVLAFMKVVANACGKDVLLTPENESDHPIFRYSPQSASWQYQLFF